MHVVSVFGPFDSRVLVEMSTGEAGDLFPDVVLAAAGSSRMVDATERDLERIRKRDADLADSALAASAVAMAYEIDHPYNSATSKSMCQARLADAMKALRDLAPPEEAKDGIDQLAERRADRLSKTADMPRS
jgi:hypothetical protein